MPRVGKGAVFAAVMVLCSFAACGAAAPGGGAVGETIAWPSGAGGWTQAGEASHYEGRAIFDYMDGAGEVYLAFNFRQLAVCRFERPGHSLITAELFEMGSPADAFGVFSFDRQDLEAHIGQGSEFGGGLLRFWKGKYFASIYVEGDDAEGERAVLDMGGKLAESLTETGEPPRILRALPLQGQVEGSAKFLRSHVLLNQKCFISPQNVLELGPDTEAALARYDLGKEKACLVIVGYPDTARAASALAGFRGALMSGAGGQAAAPAGDNTWTGAEIRGTHVIIALRAPDEGFARRLLEEAALRIAKEAP